MAGEFTRLFIINLARLKPYAWLAILSINDISFKETKTVVLHGGALHSCKRLATYLDSNDKLTADVLAVTLHLDCLHKSYSQL